MKQELELLHEFVRDMAAKGYIQIGQYLKLDRALFDIETQRTCEFHEDPIEQ